MQAEAYGALCIDVIALIMTLVECSVTQVTGESGCAGVTTGQLLCSCVGSRGRAEYSIFGDAANLAARLMGKAASGDFGAVLCDSNTRDNTKDRAEFMPLAPMVLKVCFQ